MRSGLLKVAALGPMFVLIGAAPAAADTASIAATGCSPWTVPLGVTSVGIDAVGAAGKAGSGGAAGAAGDEVSGVLAVSPGQSLDVCVGVGGGPGGSGANPGGAGGGASGVSIGSSFSEPVVVAAGGGGGGGGPLAGAGGAPGSAGTGAVGGGGQAGVPGSTGTGSSSGSAAGPAPGGSGGSGNDGGGGGGAGAPGGGGGGGAQIGAGGGGGGADLCQLSSCATKPASSPARVSLSFTIPAPPTVTITAPGDGSMYSLGQSVGSSFACADGAGGPGISSCTASDGSSSGAPVNTATGGAHTFTVTAVSQDGLSSTTSVGYRVLLPPRVLLPLPANGSVFLLGQAVRSWYLCADGAGGPGLKSCVDQDGRPMGAALDTSTLGLHQFAVTATSQDGLSTTQTVTYDVVAAPRAANVRVHRHGRITLDLLMPGPGTADVYATASYRSFAVAAAAPFAAGDIAAGDLVRAPRGTTIVAREDLRAAQAATFHVSLPLTATGRLLFQFHRSAVVELSVLYLPRLGLAQTFRLAAIRDRR